MSWQKSLMPHAGKILRADRTAGDNYRALIEAVFLEFKRFPKRTEMLQFIEEYNASLLPDVPTVPLGSSAAAATARDRFVADLAEHWRSSLPPGLTRRFEALSLEVAAHLKKNGKVGSQ